MFWEWLLKYSSFLVTGVVSFVVALLLHRITSRSADLIYYTSNPQWVILPPVAGQPPIAPIGTFSLFLWNQGKAAAKDVHIGHYWLPANNVYPDIPREIVNTPGGGVALRFPLVPPRTLVTISYLFFGVYATENILSYVGSEDGPGKHIPVMLQRIFPRWALVVIQILLFAGVWVAVNALWSLAKFLWTVYYVRSG
jgi:hypothetical protein